MNLNNETLTIREIMEINQRYNRQLFDYIEGKIMEEATKTRALQQEVVRLQQEKEVLKVRVGILEASSGSMVRLIENLTARLSSVMDILEEGQQEETILSHPHTCVNSSGGSSCDICFAMIGAEPEIDPWDEDASRGFRFSI